jgi:hypothetical protein
VKTSGRNSPNAVIRLPFRIETTRDECGSLDRMRGLALVMALAAIGCRKPYQAEATAIDHGQYTIRAKGESTEGAASSDGVAYRRAYERANQVCPAGYVVVDTSADATRTYRRVAEVDTSEVTVVVRCTPTAAGPAGAQ